MGQAAVRVIGSGVAMGSPSMFPGCAVTPSGIVIAYSTVPDGWPGGTVGVRRTADGGRSWEAAQIVARPAPGEDAALGAIGLTRLRDGRLLLPYNTVTWQKGRGIEGCLLALRLVESTDDGARWSEPIKVAIDFDRPAVYGDMLELASGELLWPVWGEYRSGERWRSALLASRDGGRNWTVKSTIAFDPEARMTGKYVENGDTGQTDHGVADFSRHDDPDFRPHNATDGFNETSVVQLGDGRLLAVLRQQGVDGDQELALFVAYSADEGASWTAYARIGFSGMSPVVVRTADGRLLLGSRRFVADASVEPGVEIRVGAADARQWSAPVTLVDPHGTKLTGEYQCGYPAFAAEPGGTWLAFFYSCQPDGARYLAWNRLEIAAAASP
ncbi:MAG: exo-alpha-sialidase [Hyphomicrobiales bacterium]|nr:MAG: exo-alpha-sialidase [Hyphomicrobiales bacterium]